MLVLTDSDQNFWYKLYQIENLGFKLISDGDLEILLDDVDDANTNKLIKYVVTHSFRSLPVIRQLNLKLGLAVAWKAMAKPYLFSP